jgi:hypothetical protein
MTMEYEAFNKLAGDQDMVDVIRRAEPAYVRRKQTNPAAASITKGHAIWPWLVAIVLTLAVVFLLVWACRSTGLWNGMLSMLVTGPRA